MKKGGNIGLSTSIRSPNRANIITIERIDKILIFITWALLLIRPEIERAGTQRVATCTLGLTTLAIERKQENS